MKKLLLNVIALFLALAIAIPGETAEASSKCNTSVQAPAVYWKGKEIKHKQIGTLKVLKKTSVYKKNGKKMKKVDTLKAKKSTRAYKTNEKKYYYIGGGKYVKKNKKVKLTAKVPKKIQQQATCSYKGAKKLDKNAKQKIVVDGNSKNKRKAKVILYKKVKGKWKKVSTMNAVVGKNGIGKIKEGDGKTPKGTYRLGSGFGWGKKPKKVKYPYKVATKYDYWVDDVKSKDYNKWKRYKGNPKKKWKSFERMTHPLYKHGVIIRYNEKPIKKGAGSAIFLHVKRSSTKYTLGCVAVSEKDMVKILRWLDKDKKPIIEIKH